LAEDREESTLPSALHARLRILEQAEQQMLQRFSDIPRSSDETDGGERGAWLARDLDRGD
jgi:hypothetical protein